jgi:hypothetical protein
MDLHILTYSIYLPITILLTIWVANTLFRNGRVFLLEIFQGQSDIADAVNKLLLTGFYLINIGYATLSLKVMNNIEDYRVVFEILSYKIGYIIIILGAMHFFNLFIFYKLRKRAKIHAYESQFVPPTDLR